MLRTITCGIFLVGAALSCQTDYPLVRAYYLGRGTSHCLAGNCMQGYGKEDIGNGLVYEGRFENYVPEGDGRLYRSAELIYAGAWKRGIPADKGAEWKQCDGTKGPVADLFQPKIREHGDPGINRGLAAVGKSLNDSESLRRGRVPGR